MKGGMLSSLQKWFSLDSGLSSTHFSFTRLISSTIPIESLYIETLLKAKSMLKIWKIPQHNSVKLYVNKKFNEFPHEEYSRLRLVIRRIFSLVIIFVDGDCIFQMLPLRVGGGGGGGEEELMGYIPFEMIQSKESTKV